MKNGDTLPAGMKESAALAGYTTLGVGGNARYFLPCRSIDQLREGIAFASERSLKAEVLGAGSNIVARDEGFDGLVLKIELSGTAWFEDGHTVVASVAAGESWDGFVHEAVERGLAGVECLSGIPGTTGATPIQNVGAYGQEVANTIESVEALDRDSLQLVRFSPDECGFGYRQSRFKSADAGRFIVTSASFRLFPNRRPTITYPELQNVLDRGNALQSLDIGAPLLRFVRESVIILRRAKSMVIDPSDPNTRSAGSFFTNPVLSPADFREIENRWRASGEQSAVPSFASSDGVKIPAAWLVEHSGYPKGTRRGGAGISSHHALALVNFGCTASDILNLAGEIRNAVRNRFGVTLEQEPVIV